MKILLTSDPYLPRLGGGEHHVYYLARELERAHHQIVILTTERGTHASDAALHVQRAPYRGWISFFSLFRHVWHASRDTDLIHSHCSYRLASIAATVALLRRKPFVVTQHGLGLLPQAGASFLPALIFRHWRWWSMTRAHVIISTSEDLSKDIRALGFGSKIIAIPNGYDPEQFRRLPPSHTDVPVLLTVRRLVPKTGIQYLIAALPLLRSEFPTMRYEVVGDGRLRDILVSLAKELSVADMVTFFGGVPQEKLLPYYARASVVVFPSTAESTSLSCIEAMALGKVIVASRVGGLIELLGAEEERGYLVPLRESEHSSYDAPVRLHPNRIALLADAITHALRHVQEAEAKAKRASAYVRERFSWAYLAARTVREVYEPLQ